MRLIIEFLSDWHIGSGAGIPGHTDRMILRDADGLPFSPAKSLTGILRDSAEFVAEHLDGDWLPLVDNLFGNQPSNYYNDNNSHRKERSTPAKLQIGQARLEKNLRAILKKNEALKRDTTFVQPGVAIEAQSGRAKDKHLRFVEMARQGARLIAETNFDKVNMTESEKALLAAAILNVRRMGAKRRRGGGRCSLNVDVAFDGKSLEDWAKKLTSEGFTPEASVCEDKKQELEIESGKGEFTRIGLKLTAKQAIIAAKSVLGNEVETLDYIPGTLLLPNICKALGGVLGGKSQFDIWEAVADGRLIVTPFYPALDGEPALPAPNCIARKKMEETEAINTLATERDEKEQYKDIREGWITFGNSNDEMAYNYYAGEDLTQTTMHNTVEDKSQRPTEQVGGVYSYRAIRPDTVLFGELVLDNKLKETLDKENSGWKDALPKELKIGLSAKDDYGAAMLEKSDKAWPSSDPQNELLRLQSQNQQQPSSSSAKTDDPVKSAEEAGFPASHGNDEDVVNIEDSCSDETNGSEKKYLVVYLASDCLLRDSLLSYSADPKLLARALETELDFKNSLALCKKSAGRAARRESWQRSWEMPRPSLTGLKAGSVFLFTVKKGASWNETVIGKAKALQAKGIGERRAEGYGRILIQPEFLMKKIADKGWITIPKRRTPNAASNGERLEEADHAYFRIIELAHFKEEIRKRARRAAYKTPYKWFGVEKWNKIKTNHRESPNSQWGGLRAAVGRMIIEKLVRFDDKKELRFIENENNMLLLKKHIEAIQARANRKDKWGNGQLDAIMALVETPSNIWDKKYLDYTPKSAAPIVWNNKHKPDEDGNDHLKTLLEPFAIKTYIETICEAVFDIRGQEEKNNNTNDENRREA